jgi:hypothetical protein
MSVQPSSRLQRLVQRDRRNDPPPNDASVAPVASSSLDDLDDPGGNGDNPEFVQTEEDGDFDDVDWGRVPHLERRGKEHMGGTPSWIYRYGWPVYDRIKKRNYWICRHCHINKKLGGEYDARSTSSAATHLARRVKGHGVGPSGSVSSCHDPNQGPYAAEQRRGVAERR